MTTNVPTVTFGPRGFIAPEESAVFTGVFADIDAAFGGGLNPALESPQGQIATSDTAIIGNVNNGFVLLTNLMDPAFTFGRYQDGIARIYFLERLPSRPTVLQILCSGLEGVPVPTGSLIKDNTGLIYQSTQDGTFPAGGTMTLPFEAQLPGPSAVPQTNGVSIYRAINGWDSVSCTSGVTGRETETRAEFEARRAASVALNSVGSLPAIRGAVLNVDNVLDAYVTENDSGAPVTIGGFVLVAKSLYVAVVGGDADAVARAIWSKKAPGCAYNGNTTVTVYDDNSGYVPPLPSYTVKFETPAELSIYFAVDLVNSSTVPSDAVTQIQDALIAAFAGVDGGPKASIGAVLYALRYVAPIAALGSWAQIRSIQIGSNNTAGAIITGHIAGTTLTVASVTSGAVAVGQFVTDQLGRITSGTRILSGAGSTWTVNNSQTVAGATFTGTGAGTNLTVSAVTGVIGIGDVISGTGVPGGTTIDSQTSGTTGGAGVYVTSNATTSVGAAITANGVITGAAANQTLVSVQIDQEPTLAAEGIVVTLS